MLWFAAECLGRLIEQMETYRRLGRALLLGLEFLVAADIVAMVMIDPSPRSVASLGLVVLIRTFLS